MAWQLAISGHVVFKSNHGEVLPGRVVMETAHLVTNCGSEETFVQAETALSQVDTEVSVDKARREKSTRRGRKGKGQETQCFKMDTDGRGMAGASVCAWSPRKGHTRPRIRKAQQPRMIDQTP